MDLECKAFLMLEMWISRTWAPARWGQSYITSCNPQGPREHLEEGFHPKLRSTRCWDGGDAPVPTPCSMENQCHLLANHCHLLADGTLPSPAPAGRQHAAWSLPDGQCRTLVFNARLCRIKAYPCPEELEIHPFSSSVQYYMIIP